MGNAIKAAFCIIGNDDSSSSFSVDVVESESLVHGWFRVWGPPCVALAVLNQRAVQSYQVSTGTTEENRLK